MVGHAAMIDPVEFVDRRLGTNVPLRKATRYVFPEHWSFLLGELALYSFVVLIASGTFLALFFDPSTARTTYTGSYALLRGTDMSAAYASALHLSFDVPAGLLMRQTHHWAADVFLVAIVLHLLRVFFTGAFRAPRELTYAVGVIMLGLAMLEGFAGYSLVDDLLSGMGLAIAYSVAASIPLIGGQFAQLVWDGPFPGGGAFESRLYIAHVFLLPALIATLIALHLAMIVRTRHAQFRGPLRSERNVIGIPMWPGYAARSVGLLLAVTAVLVLMGGLIQVNPIWEWGAYEPWRGTNGAQPDWYLGWLIGSLRLMPHFDVAIAGRTLIPNPFWGGVVFPAAVFGFLLGWPWRDRGRSDLLDRPRDDPRRTAVGAAVFTFVFLVFLFGSADRLFLASGVPYGTQLWVVRAAVLVAPPVVYALTRRAARELRDRVAEAPAASRDATRFQRRRRG
jgi:ubiquinol-cytochrome c reductase cytochrome b subunit